ncbi:uncharacterized protein LOC133800133 [Humulus lupulus]|uniref:uncharacterized protein LOC133800133 n=1 Tax=Humulus lupulus TaxID=3486 RepID=UPI002B405EA6|nr:uncharacterized protein LOC133800133 [Humulus lupulus]
MVVLGGVSGIQIQGWDLRFRRNLFDREVTNLSQLLLLLERVALPVVLEDRRAWLPDGNEVFSCKSAFWRLSYAQLGSVREWGKSLWKSVSPSRVKLFGWLVFNDKLNVHDNVQRRRPYHCLSPAWCVCCKEAGESTSHLFLECHFSREVWGKVLAEFGILWCMPSNYSQLFLTKLGGGKRVSRLWQTTVLATFWALWLERNNRLFEDISNSVETIWDKIKFWVATWVYRNKFFEGVPFSDLIRDWGNF